MQEGIYPLIEGTNHASLLYYYTLLQGSEIEDSVHSPEVHVKLLKKIKSGVPSEWTLFIFMFICNIYFLQVFIVTHL